MAHKRPGGVGCMVMVTRTSGSEAGDMKSYAERPQGSVLPPTL